MQNPRVTAFGFILHLAPSLCVGAPSTFHWIGDGFPRRSVGTSGDIVYGWLQMRLPCAKPNPLLHGFAIVDRV
jgi:hypothetical protein